MFKIENPKSDTNEVPPYP